MAGGGDRARSPIRVGPQYAWLLLPEARASRIDAGTRRDAAHTRSGAKSTEHRSVIAGGTRAAWCRGRHLRLRLGGGRATLSSGEARRFGAADRPFHVHVLPVARWPDTGGRGGVRAGT